MKQFIQRRLPSFVRRTFGFWERLGVHVTLVDYYSPIPDTREVGMGPWRKWTEMPGVRLNEEGQFAFLDLCRTRYKGEYEALPRDPTANPVEYYENNAQFRSCDAEVLHCMIREHKPRRIIEVGSGNSTYLISHSLALNKAEDAAYACDYTVIDPYPAEVIRTGGVPGVTRMIAERVQDVPVEEFAALSAGDILFIDSSHVLKIGSDVQFEFLELIPRVKPGVIIHIHDIFFPEEYPRDWIHEKRMFWNEQYLLQAFLAFNDAFEVLWAGSHMHFMHPARLEEAFAFYNPRDRWPGSFWMRRTR